jgi:hypothetical protein
MTQTTHEQDSTPKVEAYLVLEDARIGTLPKHFGARMMTVEHSGLQLHARVRGRVQRRLLGLLRTQQRRLLHGAELLIRSNSAFTPTGLKERCRRMRPESRCACSRSATCRFNSRPRTCSAVTSMH